MVKEKNSLEEMMMWDTLGVELMGGVPILQSLNILSECFPTYREEIKAMHDTIKNGGSLGEVFDKYSSSFHPQIRDLLLKGEENGELPSYLFIGRDQIKKEIDAQRTVMLREVKSNDSDLESKTYLGKAKFFGDIQKAMDSGSCLVSVLNDLSKSPQGYVPSTVLSKMREEILSGSTFQEAISSHTDYFDNFDAYMVKAGECSGCVSTIVDRLSEFYNRKYEAAA